MGATTTITDSGSSIKITVGTQKPRNILKSKVIELTIIKTDILKIDIGKGALENIFIPHPDVVIPLTASADALQEAVQLMLSNTVVSLENKVLQQPLIVDSGGAGVIYKGYAAVGTNQQHSAWAIERITNDGAMDVHTWADGSQAMTQTWVHRETLNYL